MRWHIGSLGLVLGILLFGAGLFVGLYRYREEPIHSSASERLQPASVDPSASGYGRSVHAPVYSSSLPRRERQGTNRRSGSHGQCPQHQLSASNYSHVGAGTTIPREKRSETI